MGNSFSRIRVPPNSKIADPTEGTESIVGLSRVSAKIAVFLCGNNYTNFYINLFLIKYKDSNSNSNSNTTKFSMCLVSLEIDNGEHNAQPLISNDTSDATYKTEDTQELCSVVEQGLCSFMAKIANIVDVYKNTVNFNLQLSINKDNKTNKITIGRLGNLAINMVN